MSNTHLIDVSKKGFSGESSSSEDQKNRILSLANQARGEGYEPVFPASDPAYFNVKKEEAAKGTCSCGSVSVEEDSDEYLIEALLVGLGIFFIIKMLD